MIDNKQLASYQHAIGYQNAPLATKQSPCTHNTIGILVNLLDTHFTDGALKGIREVADAAGYQLIIANSQGSIAKQSANARLLLCTGVAGVIASQYGDINKTLNFDAFKKKQVPVILLGQPTSYAGNDVVMVDNAKCSYEATGHLIKQGCKRILMVSTAEKMNFNIEYYKGYKQALKEYDMPADIQPLIFKETDKNVMDSIAAEIMQIGPRPDGLFFTNDLYAAHCMQALKQRGITVPDDIAIVGFENNPISRLVTPALTTIDCPCYEAGKVAATAVVDHLTKKTFSVQGKTTIMPTRLIVRNSSLKASRAIA